MQFENNWARSPFREHLYDPVLKLHMRDTYPARMYPENAACFKIYYDPSIVAGQYSRPPSQEEIDKDISWNADRIKHEWFRPIDPYQPRVLDTTQEKNIMGEYSGFQDFYTTKTPLDDVLRIKPYGSIDEKFDSLSGAIFSINTRINELKKNAPPVISEHPKEFFLYAYRGYIMMPELIQVGHKGDRFNSYKNIQRVELCMHVEMMKQVFDLSPKDYLEVEPNWHCLTSTDWPSKEVQA